MKKWKQILALVLTLALCLALLAGCASKTKTDEPPADDTPSTPEEPAEPDTPDEPAEPDTPDEPAEPDEPDEPEEIVEITMSMFDPMANGEKAEHVEEALNVITEEKLGIHVDITWFDIGSWQTQISLMASSGDLPDIIGSFAIATLNSMYTNGELMDVSPYLDQPCAEGIMNVVGGYLDALTINGGVYGFPTYRIYATDQFLIMRKDMLDELGLTEKAQNMTTWAEFDEILAAVDENYTDIFPMGKGSGFNVLNSNPSQYLSILEGGPFSDHVTYDLLGDSTLCAVFTDNDGNVSFAYEQPGYIDMAKKVAEWYNKDWLYADSAFSTDHADVLMSTGVVFADQQASEIGIESAKKSATGYDVVCTNIAEGLVFTSTLTAWGCALSTHCEEPEAALEFLSYLYNDPDLMTLINWGVEGVDYVMNENGEATFPEGKDNSNAYHYGDWILGNQFLVKPWAGQGGDFRETSLEANEKVSNSPYLGFVMDTTGMDSLIAALTSVNSEYSAQILCGLYTDDLYNEYISKMKTAGVDEYLAKYQEQLTAWMNAQ